ncbi:hypothetical protein V1506DRAFT_466612 [Lipomyces tetrasporus]
MASNRDRAYGNDSQSMSGGDSADQSTADAWSSVYNAQHEQQPQGNPNLQPVQSEQGQEVLFMCHGCYNEFHAVPNSEFPVLCPRCNSDFCEIIDDPEDDPRDMIETTDDEDEDDEDYYFHSRHPIPDIPFTAFGGPYETRSERERQNTANVMNFVQFLSTIMHEGQQNASNTAGGSGRAMTGRTIATEDGSNHPMLGSTMGPFNFTVNFGIPPGVPRSAHEEAVDNSNNISPMEQLANFLQQTFRGIGVEPHVGNAQAAQGAGGQLPDLTSQLLGRIFNVSGNPSDYVFSNRQLDQIITQIMEQTAPSNAPPPATAGDISALPTTVLTPELHEQSSDCAICKDQYEASETVTLLPCKHFFHPACIKHWLSISDSCPICRHPITAATASPPSDNAEPEQPRSAPLEPEPEPLDD